MLLCAAGLSPGGCDPLPSDGPNANGMLAHSSSQLKGDAASTAVTRDEMATLNARIAEEDALLFPERGAAGSVYSPEPPAEGQ